MSNTTLFMIFVGLSVVNVVLNTIKAIITVKGNWISAALINGLTFFVYTYVLIYTQCDLNMHLKALITGLINVIGVGIVKFIEMKARKDKLWKVEMTVKTEHTKKLNNELNSFDVPHNYTTTNDEKWTTFNCYCATQKDSQKVKDIINQYEAKYFVSESKTL